MDQNDIPTEIKIRRQKLAEKKREMELMMKNFLERPVPPIETYFGPEFKRKVIGSNRFWLTTIFRRSGRTNALGARDDRPWAMLEERDENELKKKADLCVRIKLQETPTISLFHMPVTSVPSDGDGADKARWYNECFLKWNEVKKEKRMRDKFVQTGNDKCISKQIQTDHVITQDKPMMCSIWDQYDSHQSANNGERKNLDLMEGDRLEDWPPRIKKSLDLSRFRQAVTVTERVMSSNVFNKEQMAFTRDEKAQMGVKYKADPLWTCVCPQAMKCGRVNDICWNRENRDLVAVAYGQLGRGEGGLICCWSVKSPLTPERMFNTDGAPTSISFSTGRPHLLAVATYRGAVLLIDITSKTSNVVALNRDSVYPLSEPLWCVQWYTHSDGVQDWENIMTVGQAGEVHSWNITDRNRSTKLMQLRFVTYRSQKNTPSGGDKGQVGINLKTFTGLACSVHPTQRSTYYVATSNGCVIVCETQNELRYKEIFPAHCGPVYGIRHSPFWDKVFATYGGDSYLVIWLEGIDTPLVKLKPSENAVLSADWSPTHPSVLATSSGDILATWDLGRKSSKPLTTIKSPNPDASFTSVTFSPKGNNILAGCTDGSVVFYNLTEMPYPPFLQKEALKRALQKVVQGKTSLAQKLEAIYHG